MQPEGRQALLTECNVIFGPDRPTSTVHTSNTSWYRSETLRGNSSRFFCTVFHIWGPSDRLFKCGVKFYGMQKVHSCFFKDFFFITDTWENYWISFLTVTYNQILLVNFFACWRILAWDAVVGALACFPTEPPVFSKATPSTCLRESIEVACPRGSV
jgi:hypothetical protein